MMVGGERPIYLWQLRVINVLLPYYIANVTVPPYHAVALLSQCELWE